MSNEHIRIGVGADQLEERVHAARIRQRAERLRREEPNARRRIAGPRAHRLDERIPPRIADDPRDLRSQLIVGTARPAEPRASERLDRFGADLPQRPDRVDPRNQDRVVVPCEFDETIDLAAPGEFELRPEPQTLIRKVQQAEEIADRGVRHARLRPAFELGHARVRPEFRVLHHRDRTTVPHLVEGRHEDAASRRSRRRSRAGPTRNDARRPSRNQRPTVPRAKDQIPLAPVR